MKRRKKTNKTTLYVLIMVAAFLLLPVLWPFVVALVLQAVALWPFAVLAVLVKRGKGGGTNE